MRYAIRWFKCKLKPPKKLEKLKNQKGGDPQDKTQYPVGRGRGQPPRQGQQVGRPPLTPTAPPPHASSTNPSTYNN